MSLVTIPNTIQSGNSDDPTRDMANWNVIANVINGQLGDVNFNAADPLTIAKTTLGTYTTWASWTPTWGGFSADPAGNSIWCRIGNVVFCYFNSTANGTSNATTLTMTLPVAPVNGSRHPCWVVDGGVVPSTPGEMRLTAGSTTVDFYKTFAGGVWSNSGEKTVYFSIFYRV